MSEEAAQLRRELNMARAQISRLESVSRQVWQYQPAVMTPAPFILTVGQGNTITTISGTDYKGMKYPAAAVTTVPAATPAAIDTACPDGISPAYLISGNGTSLAWVGTYLKPGTAAAVVELTGSLYFQTPIQAYTVVQMPISGAPTTFAPVYVPFRIG